MKTARALAALAAGAAALLATAAPATAEGEDETYYYAVAAEAVVHTGIEGVDDAGSEPAITTTCGNELREIACNAAGGSGGLDVSVAGETIAEAGAEAGRQDGPMPDPAEDEPEPEYLLVDGVI